MASRYHSRVHRFEHRPTILCRCRRWADSFGHLKCDASESIERQASPECRLSLIDARFLFPHDPTNSVQGTPEKRAVELSGLDGVLGYDAARRPQQRILSIRCSMDTSRRDRPSRRVLVAGICRRSGSLEKLLPPKGCIVRLLE